MFKVSIGCEDHTDDYFTKSEESAIELLLIFSNQFGMGVTSTLSTIHFAKEQLENGGTLVINDSRGFSVSITKES